MVSKNQVEAADVFRADPTDARTSENLLGVNDRGTVRANGRGLALQRIQPPVSPVGEADVRAWAVVTILEGVLYSEQRQLGLLTISTSDFSVGLFALADDHVVDGPLRASAACLGSIERRPRTAKGAPSGVLRLKASHVSVLMSNDSLL